MDIVFAPSELPIRWDGVDYKVVRAGLSNGLPYVTVMPSNPEFENILKAHIDKYQDIEIYWKDGYSVLVP
jgi:hypothetical protein